MSMAIRREASMIQRAAVPNSGDGGGLRRQYMIFHEIYGRYYSVVAKILEEALMGNLTKERLTELSIQKGFSESVMHIPSSLLEGKWALLDKNMETPIKYKLELPMTMLQKGYSPSAPA